MSLAEEFIELANELFEDGATASIAIPGAPRYDAATLTNQPTAPTIVPTKVVFISPQQSTVIEFDVENSSEEYGEKKVASVNYRGDLPLGSKIAVEGDGEYTVYGKVRVNPTGPTIYHRVKMGR